MATVMKCDICGTICEQYPEQKFIRMSVLDKKSPNVYGENEIDCCPECTEKILGLVDIMKTYPDRWVIDILNEV